MPYPDRFYPVVDSVAWVARLARLGTGTIQLRVKDLTHAAALALVREALAAAGPARLVVNDYWHAAIEAKAQHLHLGQEDLATADVAAIRRAGLTLGLSTHDEAELDRAMSHDPDYVALGPIYPTTVKPMRAGPQGLARITQWKKLIGATPLCAIGGITLERAGAVYAAGADSIAVVTDITRNADPDARVRAWLAADPASAAA
ncbi:MAG TPA: thiamine phosphate synthase [Pseudolabrys sp.]|nr:thiamine phosphate synthase [Pseudolabrys sp.]